MAQDMQCLQAIILYLHDEGEVDLVKYISTCNWLVTVVNQYDSHFDVNMTKKIAHHHPV